MAKNKNLYKFADSLEAFVVVIQWSDEDDCYEGYVTDEALDNDSLMIDMMKRTSLYDGIEMKFADAVTLWRKAKAQYPDRKVFIGEDINGAIDSWNFSDEDQPTPEQESIVDSYLRGLHKAYSILNQ